MANRRLCVLFVLVTLPVCLFLALAVPFGDVPDEDTHIARAAGLLGGALIGHAAPVADPAQRRAIGPGFDIDPAFAALGRILAPGAGKTITAAMAARARAVPWSDHVTFVRAWNMALYAPVFYVPAATALGVARALGAGPYHAIIAARLVNVAAYTALSLLALGSARRGAALLFAVLALPMSLSLAASFNQDGSVIAGSALAASLLTGSPGSGGRRYGTASILLAAVILAKPPLLPLAALLLIPAGIGVVWRAGALLLCALPVLLWSLATAGDLALPALPPRLPGPLFPGDAMGMLPTVDPALQWRVFASRPALLLTLPSATLYYDLPAQGHMLVGVLGTLDIVLPGWLYTAWYAALAAALATTVYAWRPLPGMLVLLALGCSVAGIYDLLYLTWTPLGAPGVQGVQGRYFLPLLPALIMASSSRRLPGSALLTAVPVSAALIDLAELPQIVLHTYYLR